MPLCPLLVLCTLATFGLSETVAPSVTAHYTALETTVAITSPAPEGRRPPRVGHRPEIVGFVADGATDVWVVVHPAGSEEFWVQPEVEVDFDGGWSVRAHVGREGDADRGVRFEVVAVVGPEDALTPGQVLDGWPEAQAASEVLVVVRE